MVSVMRPSALLSDPPASAVTTVEATPKSGTSAAGDDEQPETSSVAVTNHPMDHFWLMKAVSHGPIPPGPWPESPPGEQANASASSMARGPYRNAPRKAYF